MKASTERNAGDELGQAEQSCTSGTRKENTDSGRKEVAAEQPSS